MALLLHVEDMVMILSKRAMKTMMISKVRNVVREEKLIWQHFSKHLQTREPTDQKHAFLFVPRGSANKYSDKFLFKDNNAKCSGSDSLFCIDL